MKLKKGDTIIVTVGKDKGKSGKIEKVFLTAKTVLVPGVNQYKKHVKKQSEQRPGEIVTLSRPLQIGNVALICPKCKQPTRVGYQILEDKKLVRKIRICRKCDQPI